MSSILDNRGEVESLVLSTLFQDLSLIADISLTEKDFTFSKTKFFFNLIKEIGKKYVAIDEVTVSSFVGLSPTLKDSYENYGGWEAISKVSRLGNVSNFTRYVDDLEKSNLILKLEEKGFNIEKEIEIEGIKVKPIDVFPNMTSQQVYEFYEMLLADASVNTVGDDIVVEDLIFTDDEIEDKKTGSKAGTPYNIAVSWEEDGDEHYITACPSLSNITSGVTSQNGLFTIAGTSGLGKTTFTFTSIILGLVNSGSKVVIVSNEQQVDVFKDLLLTYICKNVFKCYTINRRKIKTWNLTDSETEVVSKARTFIKDRYANSIKFVSMIDFNVQKIMKVAKKIALSEGYDTLFVDTFKADSNSEDTVRNLVQGSRELDSFGKRMNMKIIHTFQIATYAENKVSYLSAAELSGSKQIKEVCNVLLLFRKVTEIELDPTNKAFYIKPYKYKQKLNGEYEQEEIELNPKKQYILCFVSKNREGADGQVLIYSFDGHSGRFYEEGYAGFISRKQLS